MPEPRPTDDVPYHHARAPGQKYLVLDAGVVQDSPVYVALRRIDYVPRNAPRWLDPHEHLCNSFYVFIGDGPDLSGLTAVVEIERRAVQVSAPAAAMIPPRTLHHYWLLTGSGWYVQITLSPTYVESLVPSDEIGSGRRTVDAERLVCAARREGSTWRLVDTSRFDAPGVTVTGVELAEASSTAVAGGSRRVDVVLGRRGERAYADVRSQDGPWRVASPGAVYSRGLPPSIVATVGEGIVVRIALE